MVYRNHDELKATLCSHVDKDQHINHPEEPYLQLEDGNAFQAIGTLVPAREFTKDRVERPFNVPKKKEPSSLIATYPNLGK